MASKPLLPLLPSTEKTFLDANTSFYDFGCAGDLPASIPYKDGGEVKMATKPFGEEGVGEFFSLITSDRLGRGLAPRMLMLFGAKGVGKTYNVFWHAACHGINVLLVNSLFSNDCPNAMHLIFEEAKRHQPCLVLFPDGADVFLHVENANGTKFVVRNNDARECRKVMDNLREEDRVWVVVTTWRSLRFVNDYFDEIMKSKGMIATVPSVAPDKYREQFARNTIARFTRLEPSKVPNHAVQWIVDHSDTSTFREVMDFIRQVVYHTHSTAPKEDRINNEALFSENNLVHSIRECLNNLNNKDERTGRVFSEYTIAGEPDAKQKLNEWHKDFEEAVKRKIAVYVPSRYISEAKNPGYRPPPPSFYNQTASSSSSLDTAVEEGQYHEPSISPEIDDRIHQLRASGFVPNRGLGTALLQQPLSSSAPNLTSVTADLSCPTSPSYVSPTSPPPSSPKRKKQDPPPVPLAQEPVSEVTPSPAKKRVVNGKRFLSLC